tara:strand:- start:1118 stop:1282 length:165 start_codon:yes stop_codon:yes gene_type:complete
MPDGQLDALMGISAQIIPSHARMTRSMSCTPDTPTDETAANAHTIGTWYSWKDA